MNTLFSFSVLIHLFILGYGLHSLYTWGKLTAKKQLFPSKVLYPSGCSNENCKDEAGYLSYIRPKTLIVGVVCVIDGIISLCADFSNLFSSIPLFTLAVDIIFFATVLWIAIKIGRAADLYW